MHIITTDHLELKLPYQENVPETSPLILGNLKYHVEKTALANEWEGATSNQLDVIHAITGLPFKNFKRRTASQTNSYRFVYTLNNLVDVKFRKYGENYVVDSIVVHGKGWQIVPYSAQKMVATAATYGLKLDIVHYKLDVSRDVVSFDTLDNHFLKKSYTSNATATPFHSADKADGTKAIGWRVGSLGHNGYCVSIYEASKVHFDLPAGTWRLELQAKGATAIELLQQKDLPSAVLSLVNNRLKFRSITSNNSNRSQRPVTRWWNSIMQGAGSFRVTHSNPAPVLEKRKERLVSDLYSRCTSLGEPVFTDALQDFINQFLPSYKLVPIGG